MNGRRWGLELPILAGLCLAGCTVGVGDSESFGGGDAASNGADAGDDDDDTGDTGGSESGDTDEDADEAGSTGEDADESGDSTGGSDGEQACDADLDSDPDHCGECDHSCLGGLCESGACQPQLLAANLTWPNAAVIEGDRLVVGADDGLFSVPKVGGGGELLHAGTIRSVLVDAERIYWVDTATQEIASIPMGGMEATIHLTLPAAPQGLVADDGNLFYVDGGIERLSKGGGNPHAIVDESGDPFDATDLAIGDGRVYYRTEGGDLRSVLSTGGGDLLLASNPVGFQGVGYHDGLVYAFRGDDDGTTLVRMPPEGDGAVEELVSGQASPQSIAFDDTHVYWRTFSEATSQIHRMPLEGGAAELLRSFPGYSQGLAVDHEAIYWCETDQGNVVKLAK